MRQCRRWRASTRYSTPDIIALHYLLPSNHITRHINVISITLQYYVQNNLYHKDPSSPPARSPSKQALLSPSSSAGRLQASRPSSAASRPSSAARRAAVSRPSSAQERPPAAACSSGGPPAAVSRGAKLAVLGPSPGLPAIAPPSRRPGNPSRGRVEAKGKPSPKVAPKIGSSSDGVTDEALAIIGANTNLDP